MSTKTGLMNLRINGEWRSLAPQTRIGDLVEGDRRGVAIARNGEIVPCGAWDDLELRHGDEIEIVKAVQGG